MRKLNVAALLLVLLSSPASAASPVGEWLVADKSARIQIAMCRTGLWGIVAWLKAPAFDDKNPDPSKRTRDMIGTPILLGMKEDRNAGRWNGSVYNAENGKTYDAHIRLQDDDTLRIDGCVLGGMICSGENWTRVPAPEPASPQHPKRATPLPAAPARDVCAGVSLSALRIFAAR